MVLGFKAEQHAGNDQGREQTAIHQPLCVEYDRTAGHGFRELAPGQNRPGERDPANENRQEYGERREAIDRAGSVVERRPAHQQTGDAARAVEQRHHLRHRRHLYRARNVCTHATANDAAQQNPLVIGYFAAEQGDQNGNGHADGRQHVAAYGSSGRAELFKTKDKQRGAEYVDQIYGLHAHYLPAPAAGLLSSFFLNMASMRLVTM